MTVPQLPGARVRSRKGGSAWEVRAERLDDLQALVACSVGRAAIERLEVEVAHWRPPVEGWIGRPGIPRIGDLAIELRGTGVRVRLGLTRPVDAALGLAAVVRCLRPVARDRGPELTFGPGLPAAAASLAGTVHDVLPAEDVSDPHLRRCDVLLVGEGDPIADVERAVTVVVGDTTWTRDGQPFDVDVDPTVHRPVGRRSTGPRTVARATVTSDRVTFEAPDARIVVGRRLAEADVAALRSVGAVVADALPVAIDHQLRACGILVARPDEELPADDLAWQARSVHERRHALRQFGPAAALDAWPSVSIVLVTHRSDHLEHAMRQLGGLRYPRLEVVIGAHGDRVDPAALWELAQDLPFPATVVCIDGTCTLGDALQACSDRAEGDLVTKMDDDDHYGAEHVWDLVLARQYSGAQLVGKALDWVHIAAHDTTVFRPVYGTEKYAGFVAGGTILISRGDLAAVGGWRPVPKSVDRALLDRVLADGGLVYRTHGLGYVYVRRGDGHTATVRDEHFLTKTVATYPGLLADEALGTAGGAA